MSSCNRRKALAWLAATPVAAALSACGFTPAYGPAGGASRLTDRVEVSEPSTTETYLMTRHLEDRLGRTDTPDYRLSYDLALSEERIAITANNITRRFNLVGTATYTLETLDGRVITEGSVENFAAYSATGSTVATRAARRTAQERLTTILADDIVTRLIAAAPSA